MRQEKTVTAILGSPRRGGNSDTLALEFLRGASSKGYGHKIIIPTDLGIAPCDGDNRCFTDGRCVVKDGMNEVYERVTASRYLLIATPIYFMGPPGSLKSFIDRFQAVWARSAILKSFDPDSDQHRANHKAFAIIVGAAEDRPAMYRPAISIIKAFLNVIGFRYDGEIIATGLEKQTDAKGRDDLLEEAFHAGQTFIP